MYIRGTKIEREVKICMQQTKSMKTNAKDYMKNSWNHFMPTASTICGVKTEHLY
jgi:hypothetical protein